MREYEAKTKWCPMARVADEDPMAASANRSARGAPWGKCIASECMAWEETGTISQFDSSVIESAGYCGLVK